MSFESAALLAAWIVLVLQSLALAGILRQIASMQAGGPRSVASTQALLGTRVEPVRELPIAGERVLLFLDQECHRCEMILERTRDLVTSGDLRNAIAIFRGPQREAVDHLPSVEFASELFEQFSVSVVPFAVAHHSNLWRQVHC